MTIALVYQETPASGVPAMRMHIRFSTTAGASWTAEDTFTDGGPVVGFPWDNEGMAVVLTAPNGDMLCLTGNQAAVGAGTVMRRSLDGGKTWGVPASIVIAGLSVAETAITYALDQALVLGTDIYISCIQTDGVSYHEELIKSPDSGVTWTHLSRIGSTLSSVGEAGFTYIGNNTFVAVLRGGDDRLYRCFSFDMGLTWTSPGLLGVQGGRPHIYTRAQLKGLPNWWTDNVLLMCGFKDVDYSTIHDRINGIWISRNFGASWSSFFPVDVQDLWGGYGDLFYRPATAQYVLVSYKGTFTVSSIKQYNLTIGGI